MGAGTKDDGLAEVSKGVVVQATRFLPAVKDLCLQGSRSSTVIGELYTRVAKGPETGPERGCLDDY